MACGLPVITSHVGLFGPSIKKDFFKKNPPGYVCDDWYEKFMLNYDGALRTSKKYIEDWSKKYLSMDRFIKEWQAVVK